MYKEVLRSIDGVAIFPIISLIIFGFFFSGLFLYVFGFKKRFIEDMSKLPLEETPTASEELLPIKNQ